MKLTDSAKHPWQLRAVEGGGVLLFFGYTNSPHIRPGAMDNPERSAEPLGSSPDRIRVIMALTDSAPEAERHAVRVVRSDPGFVGLTNSHIAVGPGLRTQGR